MTISQGVSCWLSLKPSGKYVNIYSDLTTGSFVPVYCILFISKMIKILLAEDDEIMRVTVSDRLKKNHWQVDAVDTGLAAVNRLKRESYQLVISDIRMPELNGWDVLSFVRKYCPETETLLITSYDNSENNTSLALEKGATGIMFKPFDLDQLVVRVNSILNQQEKG